MAGKDTRRPRRPGPGAARSDGRLRRGKPDGRGAAHAEAGAEPVVIDPMLEVEKPDENEREVAPPAADAPMRIARALAIIGIASRRDAERLVTAGRVRVDGQLVRDPAFSVFPDQVQILLDGKVVEKLQEYRYIALNKPVGVVSTVRDPHATRTVMDFVERDARLYPVGRLDKDSEGLILLTNDGSFANVATHPRYGVEKEYRALVRNRPTRESLERLQRGVMLDGESARAVQADMERQGRDGTWVRLVLKEGRKREVRRMLEAVGHPVLRLIRTRVGPIRLGNLASGTHRELSEWEVRRLIASARPERRPRSLRRAAEAAAEAAMIGEGAFATSERESEAGAGRLAAGQDRRDPPLLIAIDGPAGAGKSTVGSVLAERLRAPLVDTGLFYRVVTLLALERGIDFADSDGLAAIARELEFDLAPLRDEAATAEVQVGDRLLGPELRTPEVDASVSVVASSPEVRAALIEPQRRALAGGRAVVVGRDIGTVICPDADVKIYLEATPEERARRRARQLGETQNLDEVRAAVDRRDELDRSRSVAPLEVAPDAVVVETDGIPLNEVVKRIYRIARDREAARG